MKTILWNLEEDDNQIFISTCLFGLFIQQSGFWGYAYEIYVWYVREQLDTLSHEMSHVSLPFFIFLVLHSVWKSFPKVSFYNFWLILKWKYFSAGKIENF